jgi:hypothetical protein
MRSDLLFDTIKELRAELDRLDHVIRQVEALAQGRVRRGRPPKGWPARPGPPTERPGDDSSDNQA